ncbi:hypothetical protein N8455_00340, partial [Candidatus Gracilibacteria bacterium]|nr:hypothetical protein [Candidatus Gracilibacteria bacterium]
ISITIIFVLIITSFLHINHKNYGKHKEIRRNYVSHPEGLPTKGFAALTSFGFENLKADLYWIQTIQYIGGTAASSEYKKYLFAVIDTITHLNPYFEHPYIIGQLLLPGENQRYEDLTRDELTKHNKEAIDLGLKGMNNFCDPLILEKIRGENNLLKIWSNDEYKNPCKSYKIPYYLAYVYFHYNNEPAIASEYYKISSTHDDAVEGAKSMAAIMAGKGGDREKSIFMFLNIAESVEVEKTSCGVFANELNLLAQRIFITKDVTLSGEIIKQIQTLRENIFGLFKEDEENQMSDTSCMTFLNKANREFNLAYVVQGNEVYKKDHEGNSAYDAQELFDKGYIDFLPLDYQQYEDQGIRYMYNEDIGDFDYKMYYGAAE